MLRREFHVLVIEDNAAEEKRIMAFLAEHTPGDHKLRIHWHRSVENGLRFLIGSHYDIQMIFCHNLQPARVATAEERRNLSLVKERPERTSEVWRLMTCMSVLQMDRPLLIGLSDRIKDTLDLQRPKDYHGPVGFYVARHNAEAWSCVSDAVTELTFNAAA